MLSKVIRLSMLALVAGFGAASAQGTFGHIAYGDGWQTTFTVVNQDQSTIATANLYFYSDTGATLSPTATGCTGSPCSFSVAPSGSTTVVLPDVGTTTFSGWASLQVTNGVSVSGQAVFRQNLGGAHPILEAAVPLTGGAPVCIISIWNEEPTHYILVPFDNTTGSHTTALAFANTTAASMAVPIEFDNQAGTAIVTDTLTLPAMNHTAYLSTTNYPATAGQVGVLRITLPASANIGDLTALALLANSVSGTLTTVLPITQ
jgi:hypothetical protein